MILKTFRTFSSQIISQIEKQLILCFHPNYIKVFEPNNVACPTSDSVNLTHNINVKISRLK